MARGLLCLSAMLLNITWHGETTAVDLNDGTLTIGGAPEDGIYLRGLEPALLSLTLEGERCTLKARKTLKVGASLFPAHVGRILLEGESVVLPNDVTVHRPIDAARAKARKELSTAFLAKELMGAVIPTAPTRAASLVCVAGPDVGKRFLVPGGECTLGRGHDVDTRLLDRAVSRHHARLVRRGRDYFVEDLGTTNGVFLNGLRVKGFRKVSSGDVLELGQSMLRFEGPERATGEDTVLELPDVAKITEKETPRVTVVDRPGEAKAPAFRATRSDLPEPPLEDCEVDLGDLSAPGPLALDATLPTEPPHTSAWDAALLATGAVLAALGASAAALVLR